MVLLQSPGTPPTHHAASLASPCPLSGFKLCSHHCPIRSALITGQHSPCPHPSTHPPSLFSSCAPLHEIRSAESSLCSFYTIFCFLGIPCPLGPRGFQRFCGPPSPVHPWKVGGATNTLTAGLMGGQESAVCTEGQSSGWGCMSWGKRSGRAPGGGPSTLPFQRAQVRGGSGLRSPALDVSCTQVLSPPFGRGAL